MSEVVVMERVVSWGPELFEDEPHLLMNKPLDVGRLLYVKLKRALDPDTPMEVIWNHFDKDVIVQVGSLTVQFYEMQMARSDMLERIDQLVAQIKENEQSLL